MTPTISVAMATYAGAAHVAEQLRSVLEQTVPPAEIVICDDGSSDGTVELIRGIAAGSAIPIRLVVNEERLGWRANAMRAASLAESEIIAFCDQDDVWDRRKLEVVVRAFRDPEVLVVFHDATIVGPALEPIGPFLQGAGEPDRAGALRRGPWRDVYGFTVAFRRELLALWRYWPRSADKSVGGQRAAHDQWVLFLGTVLGVTLHLPEPLTLYRQHDRNAVGAKDALRRPSRLQGLLQYRDAVTLRLVVLDGRIRLLEEMIREPGRAGRAAASALTTHLSYRRRLALQTDVHVSSSRSRRLRAVATLLLRGAYSDDVWALGRRTVLDDLVAAVLGPAGLARLRR